MVDGLSNIDDEDAGKQRSLSQKERNFLITGESGSYTNAEMERRVSSKTEMIPDRLQQLIDDMSLLYSQGYLDSKNINDEFSLTNRSRKIRDSHIMRPAGYDQEETTVLGFEIGYLLRMLSGESVPDDLVWGIIVGLVGESTEDAATEAGNLLDLVEKIEKKHEARLFGAKVESYMGGEFEEERKEIRKVLQQKGFAPAPPLVDGILLGTIDTGAHNKIEREEKPWGADPLDIDIPEPPNEMPSKTELRYDRIEKVIERFDKQTRLRALDRLAKDLQEDAIRIQRRDWRGIEPDPAFQHVVENGVTQIADFEQKQMGQNNMTTTLRRISNDYSDWVNRPVLREKEDHTWVSTDYGKLLYLTRVDHHDSPNWIYDFILDPANLDREASELITEVLD